MFLANTCTQPIFFQEHMYIQLKEEISTSLDYALHTINVSCDKLQEFRKETSNDPFLSKLLQLYRNGWPKNRFEFCKDLRYYRQFRDKLYEDAGLLFMKEWLFVPSCMRHQMLQLLHETHVGITKTKKLAVTFFLAWDESGHRKYCGKVRCL